MELDNDPYFIGSWKTKSFVCYKIQCSNIFRIFQFSIQVNGHCQFKIVNKERRALSVCEFDILVRFEIVSTLHIGNFHFEHISEYWWGYKKNCVRCALVRFINVGELVSCERNICTNNKVIFGPFESLRWQTFSFSNWKCSNFYYTISKRVQHNTYANSQNSQ